MGIDARLEYALEIAWRVTEENVRGIHETAKRCRESWRSSFQPYGVRSFRAIVGALPELSKHRQVYRLDQVRGGQAWVVSGLEPEELYRHRAYGRAAKRFDVTEVTNGWGWREVARYGSNELMSKLPDLQDRELAFRVGLVD